MPRAPYRAVIVDLDRTLLRTDKTVSARTRAVLDAWRAAGGLLYAATARPLRTIASYRQRLRFHAVTTLNGALTVTPDAVIARPLRPEDAATLLGQLCAVEGAVVSAEAENGFFANTEIPEWQPTVLDDLPTLPGRAQVYKVLASHPSRTPDSLPLRVPDGVYTTVALGTLLQCMSAEATKWNGILAMLRHDGIAPEEAICFGDDQDDLEPIRRCGLGVAVANALDSVKAAADAVCGGNDEDGVAGFLAEMLGMTIRP